MRKVLIVYGILVLIVVGIVVLRFRGVDLLPNIGSASAKLKLKIMNLL